MDKKDLLNEEYKKCMSDFNYWVNKYCVLPDGNKEKLRGKRKQSPFKENIVEE